MRTMIAPRVRTEEPKLWDDPQIPPGAKWKEAIEKALASAQADLPGGIHPDRWLVKTKQLVVEAKRSRRS